jgi:hypothetical protein
MQYMLEEGNSAVTLHWYMCQGTHFSKFLLGKPFRGDDGVSLVTLWATKFQKIRTVERWRRRAERT